MENNNQPENQNQQITDTSQTGGTYQPPINPQPIQNYSTPLQNVSQSGWKSTTSLVLGIISIFTCMLIVLGQIIPIAGIILGILGLKTTKKGMAIAGIILSSIGLAFSIIIWVFFGALWLYALNGVKTADTNNATTKTNYSAGPNTSSQSSSTNNVDLNVTKCYSVNTPASFNVVVSGIEKSDTMMCHLSFLPSSPSSQEQIRIYAPVTQYASLEEYYNASKLMKSSGTVTFEKVTIDGLPAYKKTIDYTTTKTYDYLLYNPKGYALSNGKAAKAFSALFNSQTSSARSTQTMSTFKWE